MVELTISMHFQQFKDLKLPPDFPKSLVPSALAWQLFDPGSLGMHPPPPPPPIKNPGYGLIHRRPSIFLQFVLVVVYLPDSVLVLKNWLLKLELIYSVILDTHTVWVGYLVDKCLKNCGRTALIPFGNIARNIVSLKTPNIYFKLKIQVLHDF